MSIKHLDKIVSLCKRKGFVFPNSEIYGGLKASYDYGPLGVELKKAISEKWWKAMTNNSNIVGLDSSIMVHPDVWEASGHIANFNDPLTDNKDSKKRYRVDDLLSQQKSKVIDALCEILSIENKNDNNTLDKISHTLLQESDKYSNALESAGVIDPFSGNIGKWTPATQFNLMFQTNSGPSEKSGKSIYLRPETAQGIYINYLLVQNSMRLKVPFGIAQIGKAFRNEIIARNFIFRTREFEQMEIEFFCKQEDEDKWFDYWVNKRMNWYKSIGIPETHLRLREHSNDELAHYAKKTVDIEFKYPWGWGELEGIANRGTFDLSSHENSSGKDLSYFDPESDKKITPTVIEPAGGLTRTLFALLCSSYDEDTVGDTTRTLFRFDFNHAPIQIGILPLSKKDDLINISNEIKNMLQEKYRIEIDITQSIGKRYRRQDEIGTPYCITVDFDTLDDTSVTIRNRDTMEQERISIENLLDYFSGI